MGRGVWIGGKGGIISVLGCFFLCVVMLARLEREYAPLGLADVSAQKQSQTQATGGTQAPAFHPHPITERSLQSVECKSKCDCDKCDGEAVLYLGTVCGNGKLLSDNDEIEGEKELVTTVVGSSEASIGGGGIGCGLVLALACGSTIIIK
jgi:hypothetical protein